MLSVRGLSLAGARGGQHVDLVDDVAFDVVAGEAIGLVGESGSGKSLTLRALMGLLSPGVEMTAGDLSLAKREGDGPAPYDFGRARGQGLSMIFQEPMTALNPTMRVGDQITLGPRIHQGWSRSRARSEAISLLAEVGMPDPARQASMWPFELSGGLRQRVMIAMALATDPSVLLCDEPTTALDVVVQEQILQLIQRIVRERRLGVVFVTHDLAVVRRLCQRVAVMYAGRIVELGTVDEVFARPVHPYSARLLAATPAIDVDRSLPLTAIPGGQPDPEHREVGCPFGPRCDLVLDRCRAEAQLLRPVDSSTSLSACIRADELLEETHG